MKLLLGLGLVRDITDHRGVARHRSPRRAAVPLNLLGDFGSGGMLQAFGVVAAPSPDAVEGRGQRSWVPQVNRSDAELVMLYVGGRRRCGDGSSSRR